PASRASTRTAAAAKPKTLPPARSLTKQRNANAPKLVRLGGGKSPGQAQRFPLPKEFRRSNAGNLSHPVVSFSSPSEQHPRSDSLISATGLLDALGNLPKREA